MTCILDLRAVAHRYASANCTATARACEYPLAGQVLRDRGTREKPPGVLAPWQLGPPQDLGKPLDPFSSLPIGMPLRSLELLKYCQ